MNLLTFDLKIYIHDELIFLMNMQIILFLLNYIQVILMLLILNQQNVNQNQNLSNLHGSFLPLSIAGKYGTKLNEPCNTTVTYS